MFSRLQETLLLLMLFYVDAENGRQHWIAYDADSRSAGIAVHMFSRSRQCVSTAEHGEHIDEMSARNIYQSVKITS